MKDNDTAKIILGNIVMSRLTLIVTFKFTMKWQYWIVNMGAMKDGIMKVDKSGFTSQEIMH